MAGFADIEGEIVVVGACLGTAIVVESVEQVVDVAVFDVTEEVGGNTFGVREAGQMSVVVGIVRVGDDDTETSEGLSWLREEMAVVDRAAAYVKLNKSRKGRCRSSSFQLLHSG